MRQKWIIPALAAYAALAGTGYAITGHNLVSSGAVVMASILILSTLAERYAAFRRRRWAWERR